MGKSTNNSAIDQAIEALYKLNEDEELREIVRQREKALCDYYNDIGVAKREGREEADEKTRKQFVKMGWTEKQIADFFAERDKM